MEEESNDGISVARGKGAAWELKQPDIQNCRRSERLSENEKGTICGNKEIYSRIFLLHNLLNRWLAMTGQAKERE